MDAGDLKIFEAVARLGGMNRAAAELHTVQSNVTARIRMLEDELGTPLFHRHSRGVTLTDAAQRLLPYALRVGGLLAEARKAVADHGAPNGPLAIGSLETTLALRLSPLLSDYIGAHPAVDLALTTGTTCELVQAVLDHRLDGAFVCGPIDHPDLVAESFFREELAVVTAAGVTDLDALLAGGRDGAIKIVVLRAGCSYRERLEAILAKRGVSGLRTLELGTLEAIYGCVAAGLGITLLPRSLIGTVWRDGRVAVHALSPADARADTLFIRRRDAYASGALAAFLAAVLPAAFAAEAAE